MGKDKDLYITTVEDDEDGEVKIIRKGKNGEKEIEWTSQEEFKKRVIAKL